MPGIAGAVGTAPDVMRRLILAFRQPWASVLEEQGAGFALAAHAHRGQPLFTTAGGGKCAVDGEWSIYEKAGDPAQRARLFELDDAVLRVSAACRGNVALVIPDTGAVHLATEWTGTFPLYFAVVGDGFLFSSHLRPLRAALGGDLDSQAVLEFLREGHMTAGRTMVNGIRRLLPGQAVTFRNGRVQLHELSRAWTGPSEAVSAETLERRAFDLLVSAAKDALPAELTVALMMSGGWDSRTLLAVLEAAGNTILPYSHGDIGSRELRLVERICRSRGLSARLEPIDEKVYGVEALGAAFSRVETAVFPHWLRAADILASTPAVAAVAGVYGEVLGGHYGGAMIRRGSVSKALAFAASAVGRSTADRAVTRGEVLDALRPRSLGVEWCLRGDFIGDEQTRLAQLRGGIEGDLDRLLARGVEESARLVEAYLSEHRGTQYVNAQLLSCRATLDVAAPFADREVLCFASTVPLHAKIHNRVNRLLLTRRAPQLGAFPMAATLVSSRMPLLIQEASRAVRKLYESARWQLHFRSAARLPPPRLGWVNFEFLRRGASFSALLEDLRLDIWNREAIQRRFERAVNLEWKHPVHPLYDMLNKIYSVDLLLRG